MENLQDTDEVLDWHQVMLERYMNRFDYEAASVRPDFGPKLSTASFKGIERQAVIDALEGLSGPKKGVYIWGKIGAGKTHFACALLYHGWDRMVQRRRSEYEQEVKSAIESLQGPDPSSGIWKIPRPPWFMAPTKVNAPKLLEKIKADFGKEDALRITDLSVLKDLVIFDDIGVGNMSDWAQEQLYLFVNEREEQALPTIYTSNLSPDALGQVVGERVSSRIIGSCVCIGLKKEDRRKQK